MRRAREAFGLSREALARRVGVAPSTIANVEAGHVHAPDPRTLRRLCAVLALPMPGDEGLYLSLEGVAAERLHQLVGDALREYALRRRDARRFIAACAPGRPQKQVKQDRDLALQLGDLLRILDEKMAHLMPDTDDASVARSPKGRSP